MSPLNHYKYKKIYNNPIKTTNVSNSASRVYEYKNGYILNIINLIHLLKEIEILIHTNITKVKVIFMILV